MTISFCEQKSMCVFFRDREISKGLLVQRANTQGDPDHHICTLAYTHMQCINACKTQQQSAGPGFTTQWQREKEQINRCDTATYTHKHTQSCLRMFDSNSIYSSVLLTVRIKALLNLVIKGLYDALLEHSLNLKTKINLLKLLDKKKSH